MCIQLPEKVSRESLRRESLKRESLEIRELCTELIAHSTIAESLEMVSCDDCPVYAGRYTQCYVRESLQRESLE